MNINSGDYGSTRESWFADVNIYNSNDIAIIGNTMKSTADGMAIEGTDYTTGERAVMIYESENVQVLDNTISHYWDGVVYMEVDGLQVNNNDISHIQADGFRGRAIQDAEFKGNHFHDFLGSTQTLNHSDMIQIWGTGAVMQTKNVEISDNFFDVGEGAATQTIFIRNEQFGQTDRFENISIHDNVIYNAMPHGISVSDTDTVSIENNTILWNENATMLTSATSDPKSYMPKIDMKNVVNVSAEGNITSRITIDGQALDDDSNYIITHDDPTAADHYSQHFVNASGQPDASLQDLMIRADSPLFGVMGAQTSSDLQTDLALAHLDNDGDDAVTAIMSADSLQGRDDSLELSAKYTLLNGQLIDPETSNFTWYFDDGTTAEGPSIVHSFDGAGTHEVTLEIETNDGQNATITRLVEIQSGEKFDIDFSSQGIDMSDFASDIKLQDDDQNQFVEGRAGQAFELDGNSRLQLGTSNDHLAGLHTFKIDLGFNMDAGSQEGYLLQMHKTMTLNVTENGALEFTLHTSDGIFEVATDDNAIDAGQWADISLEYNGFEGDLTISVDGEQLASTQATGNTPTELNFPLQLGSHWSESALGSVDQFKMTTPSADIKTALASPTDQIAVAEAPIMAFDTQTKIPRAPLTEEEQAQDSEAYTQMLDDIATPAAPETAEEDDQSTDVMPAAATQESDDDTFIENLFEFLKEVFGMGSDDTETEAPLDLAPYAQHASPDAFSSPMALFDMVPTTGLLSDTTETGGIEGEEDDDPDYGIAA